MGEGGLEYGFNMPVNRIKLSGTNLMFSKNDFSIFTICTLLVLPNVSSFGQVPGRGSIGGSGIGGRTGGAASPRSGLGIRNNPVVNPSPSLTPSQVTNPRGSLNAGQVLNPKGSLNRPRTGVTAPNTNRTGAQATGGAGAGKVQSKQPNLDTSDSDLAFDLTKRVTDARSAGEQVLDSVVELDSKIAEVAPDKGYSERLSLDRLRTVPVFSEQPSDDKDRRELQEIVKRYQAVAKDEKQSAVNQLPEFKQTLTALQEYLTPLDVRLRKRVGRMFDRLGNDLRKYKNGESWAEYLALPEDLADPSKSASDEASVNKLLARFDKLSRDKTYEKVTKQPSFKPAYEALKAFAAKPAEPAEAPNKE